MVGSVPCQLDSSGLPIGVSKPPVWKVFHWRLFIELPNSLSNPPQPFFDALTLWLSLWRRNFGPCRINVSKASKPPVCDCAHQIITGIYAIGAEEGLGSITHRQSQQLSFEIISSLVDPSTQVSVGVDVNNNKRRTQFPLSQPATPHSKSIFVFPELLTRNRSLFPQMPVLFK